MTTLYTQNFDASTDNAVPSGWAGNWIAYPMEWGAVSGTKCLTQIFGKTWGKCNAIAARTTVDYELSHKIVFDGANIAIPKIGHGDDSATQYGTYNYLFALSGNASGVTANLTPYWSGSLQASQASGTHSIALANGDVIRIKLRVVDKVVSLWIWKPAAESMPASPLISWTDSTQRPAGFFTVMTGSTATSYGIDDVLIDDAAVTSGVTLTGPTAGNTGVASSNFTVGANVTLTGTVVVTPSDGGDGGTFTPTSVSISAGTPTATFTYTAATAGAKTISVSNNASMLNPTPITYTAVTVVVVPVDDAALLWSPYNWDPLAIGDFGVAGKCKQTNNTGAYLKFRFTGATFCKLGIDSSMYSGWPAGDLPILMYSINNGPAQTTQLSLTTTEVTLVNGGLVGTTYSVSVWVLGLENTVDRWGSSGVSPTDVVRITGIVLDGGSVSAPASIMAKKSIIYGDSIIEGHRSKSNGQLAPQATGRSPAWTIGSGLGTEYAVIGFSGQDFSSASIPLTTTWNQHSAGRSRSFSTPPDYIFVVLGTNGANSAAAVTSFITAARAACGAATHLFICVATSAMGAANMSSGVNNYKSANPTDKRVHLIDVRSVVPSAGMDAWTSATFYAEDGIHINEMAAALWGSAVVAEATRKIAAEKPVTTRTVTLNLVNSGNAAQSGLSALKWAWWDEATPDLLAAPTDQGTAETTDGSGQIVISVRSNLTVGGVGWLIVTDSNGNPATVHKAFSGPVTVA